MAWRWDTGRCPSNEHALHIAGRNESRSSMHSLRIVVGMGSRLHDFDSAPEPHLPYTPENSKVTWRRWTVSLAADDHPSPVALRTDSTFSLKNLRNSSAVRTEGGGVLWFASRRTILAINFHTLDGVRLSFDSRLDQKMFFFFKKSTCFWRTAAVYAARSWASWYDGSTSLVTCSFVGWLCRRHRIKAIAVWPWNMPCAPGRNDRRCDANNHRRSRTIRMMLRLVTD